MSEKQNNHDSKPLPQKDEQTSESDPKPNKVEPPKKGKSSTFDFSEGEDENSADF